MRLIGVVTPDAGANLELGARVVAARMRHAVLLLASICGRSHRYKKITLCIDGEGMHGVVAIKRHAAKDRLGLGGGCRLALLQGVANDAIVDLGIKPILVQHYAVTAVGTLRNGLTKSVVHSGVACAFRVLQRDQKSAGGRPVVAVIHTAPGIDVDGALRRDSKLTRVTNLVRKDRRAESVGQTKFLVGISGAILFFAHNRCRGSQTDRERAAK